MRTEFRVGNTHCAGCAGCAGSIDRALRRIEGVQGINTDVDAKRVTVEHDKRVSAAKLIEFLREICFEAEPVEK